MPCIECLALIQGSMHWASASVTCSTRCSQALMTKPGLLLLDAIHRVYRSEIYDSWVRRGLCARRAVLPRPPVQVFILLLRCAAVGCPPFRWILSRDSSRRSTGKSSRRNGRYCGKNRLLSATLVSLSIKTDAVPPGFRGPRFVFLWLRTPGSPPPRVGFKSFGGCRPVSPSYGSRQISPACTRAKMFVCFFSLLTMGSLAKRGKISWLAGTCFPPAGCLLRSVCVLMATRTETRAGRFASPTGDTLWFLCFPQRTHLIFCGGDIYEAPFKDTRSSPAPRPTCNFLHVKPNPTRSLTQVVFVSDARLLCLFVCFPASAEEGVRAEGARVCHRSV